jgi:spermidine synthase
VDAYGSIYAGLYGTFAEHGLGFVALKFALALVAVIPTATLIGGTFPMLAAAFVRDPREMGRRSALLYALNTLGAAAGSAAGALWLPERVGVTATYGVAVVLSLSIGLLALALGGRGSAAGAPAGGDAASRAFAPPRLLFIAFASGLGTLAFEILLIHAIALVLISSVYSFGAVLIVVLVALAAGAALAAASARRLPVRSLLPAALVVEAIALLALPWWLTRGTSDILYQAEGSFGSGLVLAARFAGPPLLVAGLVFPFTFRLAEGGPVGPRIGGLLASNTVGSIAGSVLASFVLLDWLGLWPSVAALGLCYGGVALVCEGSARARALRAGVVAAAAGVIAFGAANPFALPVAKLQANERLLAVAEGAHGVVTVTEFFTPRLEVDRHLKVNNEYTLSSALAHKHQQRMGHLPLLLHSDPRSVLYVGSATGETASAATLHPVEQITLVEIVPEVQQLAAEWFGDVNRGVYRNPRTRVVVEDGRNHLRAVPERYDVVVADLFVPYHPGVGAMYSLEHFRAVRRHLTSGGVFCQWLPIYQLREAEFRIIAATFLEVFPEATLWRGDFFVYHPTAALVGFADEPPPVSAIDAAARRLAERGVDDRWITDPRALWMFYLGPMGGALDLADVSRNSDGWPVFEYAAVRTREWQRGVFRGFGWPALWKRVIEAAGPADRVFPGRPFSSTWAGAALASASAMVAAEGAAKRPEAISLLRANVPADLLDPPDKTVSEFWPTLAEKDTGAPDADDFQGELP